MTAFLVDQNSTIIPHVNVSVDTSGVPTMNTVDSGGNPVATVVGGGGGGSGTVKSVAAKTPDGAGNVALVANDVNGVANMIGWNLDTNVATPASPGSPFTPVDSTFPTGGYTLLQAQSSDSATRTLDGQTYSNGDFAEYSPALGVWVRISGQGSGVTRPAFNYTAGSAWTGSTSESTQQMPLQLVPNGTTLVAGQRFQVDFYSTFSSDSGQTTVKHYVNGALAMSGITFQTTAFFSASFDRVLFIVIDSTHVLMRVEFDTAFTTRAAAEAIVTVTAAAGLSIAWTYTNSTTGHTATPVLADSRFFQV